MLGLSLGFAAVVATVGNLGRVIASLLVGWLADRLWGRRMLTVAGLILALLLIAVSLSRSVLVVGCLLVTGGICTASSPPAGISPRCRDLGCSARSIRCPVRSASCGSRPTKAWR
jgi:MFS family permease